MLLTGKPLIKLVYVAGPYTAKTQALRAQNRQNARMCADEINRMGEGRVFAVVPHLLGCGLEDSGTEEFWYAATLELMERCDGVCMVRGWMTSKGAEQEYRRALEIGLPVAMTIEELPRLMRQMETP